MEKMAGVIRRISPAYPFEFKFIDDEFNKRFQSELLTGRLSTLFAILSVIISCLGLFGLAAYTAEQQLKEIGIRKVLGASISSLAALLSYGFIQIAAVACLVAFPLGWRITHNWLSNYEYRITTDVWIFLLAVAIAFLIVILTIGTQVLKTGMSNPARTLRTE